MEVPVSGSDHIKWARITVPAQFSPSEPCCPPAPDMAGTVTFRRPSRRFTIWRIHKQSLTTLELFELTDCEPRMSGLQLVFQEPLSPYVAIYPEQASINYEEGNLFVCVVTISGAVYILRIKALHKYGNVAAVAKSDVVQFSLVSEFARLNGITSFAGAGDNICAGGRSGSILCYPFKHFNVEAKEQCFELKDSDAILGRLWGLVARVKSAGPVHSLIMQLHKENLLLFALHEDGTLRLWDLHNRYRLLNFNVYRGDYTGYIPKMMRVQEFDLQNGSRQIAFLLQNKATAEESVHLYNLQLQLGQADGAIGQATLHFQLQTSGIQGTVLDLQLLSDRFWQLEMDDKQFHLKCCATVREELLESCKLLEAELEDQLFLGQDWESLSLFQQNINTTSKAELRLSLSDLFLSRILQPGVYHQQSLQKVLEKHKRRMSEMDFSVLTREGIRKEILAVVEREHSGSENANHLFQWKAFCGDYFMSWKLSNTPYGLMLDYRTGNIGIIRRQCLSVKRSLTDFEKILSGNFTEGGFMDLIFKCTTTIERQLGKLPCSAFSQLITGNRHLSISRIFSEYLQLLEAGYDQSIINNEMAHLGVDVGRKKATEYCQGHRKLQLQLILDLQNTRNFAGSWNLVIDNIEKYIIQLTQDTNLFIKKDYPEGLEYGIICKRMVLKSTAQLSEKLFVAARNILFLLGYLIKIKGQVGVTSSEVSRIQLDLVVQLKRILLRSLLVSWLSTHFAEIAPPEDFSLHLSALHLDSTATIKPYNQHIGVQETSLSEILLGSWSKNLTKGPVLRSTGFLTSDSLLYATKVFTSWLMWGETNDERESLSSHSVTLALTLLQNGQYKALQGFLQLVDVMCNELDLHEASSLKKGNWCARLHLLGCALLGQMENNLKEPKVRYRVEKAVHCFFRVGSVVGQGTEDIQAMLKKVGMDMSLPAHGPISSWKFLYYEWVMQIFEQNRELEGACQFAHAALHEVDEAEKNAMVENTLEMSTAMLTIKGRLWANIFKFSLDRKKFKEAYCAIMSNPDKDSKYVCLRRFLIVLCEHKASEVLCGSELPYAGMLERIEQELLLKAHHSDLSAHPNPFKLLYSFHMQRSNFRRAALYMYLYSVRLKEIGLSGDGLSENLVFQEQLNSLAAAINALQLVDPMYAWLDLELYISDSSSSRPPSKRSFESISGRPSSKRIRIYANNDAGYLTQKSKALHVDLMDLQKEYTMTLAQLLLSEAGVLNMHGGDLSVENVLILLVQSGLHEMAFYFLFQFWKGSSLKSELERVLQIMTERWCTGQQDDVSQRSWSSQMTLPDPNKRLMVLSSSEVEAPFKTSKSSLDLLTKDSMSNTTCNSLQVCLEKYGKLHPHLLVVVAETMLNIDRLMELPVWLVDMFKGGGQPGREGMSFTSANPSALLRIYLDFGRVKEAAMLFLDYVKAWSNLAPADVIKRKRMCSVWFPYTLVDRLKACVLELKNSEQGENLERMLEGSLSRHFEQAHTDSSDVKSLVQNNS